MSPIEIILALALIVLLVLAAGMVAAAETAFTRISQSRAWALAAAEADDRAEDEEPPDQRVLILQRLTEQPVRALAPLTLLLVLLPSVALAVAFLTGRSLVSTTGAVVAVVMTVVALIIVMVMARGRSLLAPDAIAVRMVPLFRALAPLGFLTVGLAKLARRWSPPVEPDPDVDEQQLLAMAEQAVAIEPEEEALIKRAVAFDDTTVGDIMTPRTDLVTLRSGFAVGDALEVLALHGLSRIPVTGTDSDVDDILGAVHVKDLMVAHLDGRTKHDIDIWLRQAPFVPTSQRIANLLDDLRTGRFHMAIVVDEHGGVAGVVTLEDILEELVGEIEDEFDINETPIEERGPGEIRADGRADVGLVEEALGMPLPSGTWRTVAGCFFSNFGRVPDVGDSVLVDGYELEVLRMHGRRIADLIVRRIEPVSDVAGDIHAEAGSALS